MKRLQKHLQRIAPTLGACLVAASLLACSTPSATRAETRAELEAVAELDIPYASVPVPGLLCAGQIDEAQFDALVRAGYRSFVNLRLSSEPGTGWEGARAGSLGVEYANLPIANAGEISEAKAHDLARLLDAVRGPTVLYCGSSNRVGALLGAKAFYVDGASPEEALELGRAAGVTRLESRLKELVGL